MYVNSSGEVNHIHNTWSAFRFCRRLSDKDVYEPEASRASQTVCVHDNYDVDVLGDDASWFGLGGESAESESAIRCTRISSSTYRIRL